MTKEANKLLSEPWNTAAWKALYQNQLAEGTVEQNAELEALFDRGDADATALILAVLSVLDLSEMPTRQYTYTGSDIPSGDVSALGFCVDGMAIVRVNGKPVFVPVDSLRGENGAPAADGMQWIATKPGGYYDERTDTFVVVLPNGEGCEVTGEIDSLLVDFSVQGDVILTDAVVGSGQHYGEGALIIGDGSSVETIKTSNDNKVRQEGGSAGEIEKVEKLVIKAVGGIYWMHSNGAIYTPVDGSVRISANKHDAKWSIDNPSILKITEGDSARIEAKCSAVGITYVEARLDGQRARALVIVQPNAETMTVVNGARKELYVGETIRLSHGFGPFGAYAYYEVDWSSSDPKVAVVDSRDLHSTNPNAAAVLRNAPNGTVYGVSAGTATITATAKTPNGTLTASYVVTVKSNNVAPPPEVSSDVYLINADGKTLTYLTLMVGETYQVYAKLQGGAYDPAIFVDKKMSIDENGLVTALSPGTLIEISTSYFVAYGIGSSRREGSAIQVAIYDFILPQNANLFDGESLLLSDTAYPLPMQIEYTSSDSSVAEILWDAEDHKFRLVAKKAGTTTVRLWGQEGTKSHEYSCLLGECAVTVSASTASITLDQRVLVLQLDETAQLSATVLPENATNKSTAWASSDESVAIVSADGAVTPIGPGNASITVSTQQGGHTATYAVTVLPATAGIMLDQTSLQIPLGGYQKLTAAVLPQGAVSGVTWSSSNEETATVNPSGGIEVLSTGTTIITATTDRGEFVAECTVTVVPSATSVSINVTSPLRLYTGDTYDLTATVLPAEANHSVTYSGNDDSVLLVAPNGRITAVGPGRMTVTVKTADLPGDGRARPGVTNSCVVIVTDYVPVTGISLQSTAAVAEGGAISLEAEAMPPSASVKGLIWSSSDETIAMVDQYSGEVAGVREGSAIITVTSVDDPGIYAQCNVTVVGVGVTPVLEVVVTASGWPDDYSNPYVGNTTVLTATVTPEDADYDAIVWSIEDGDENGDQVFRITPIDKNTATLEVLAQGNSSYRIYATAGGVKSTLDNSFTINTIERMPPDTFAARMAPPAEGMSAE